MQRIVVLQVTEHGVWRHNDLRVDAAICSVDRRRRPQPHLRRSVHGALRCVTIGVETEVESQTGGNPGR